MIWSMVLLCHASSCSLPAKLDFVEMLRFHSQEECQWYISALRPWPRDKDIEIRCVGSEDGR